MVTAMERRPEDAGPGVRSQPERETVEVEAEAVLRYEDIAQDGRLTILGMPHTLGAMWMAAARAWPLMEMRSEGVLPILSHISLEGSDQPITLARPLVVTGRVELAHTRDERDQIERLLLDMSAELRGARGRASDGELIDGDGELVEAGRMFVRHVFTRPFLPPGQRRVTRFEREGMPDVPAERRSWAGFDDLLGLPPAAETLERDLVDDPCPVAFGLDHSDSNQHVNSLVYIRLFEDAVLRRLHAQGRSTGLLSRSVEIGYRKPFFAGQSARVALRCFSLGEGAGAVGGFAAADDPSGRLHCYLRLRLG